tara:strand:- start:2056 stop:2514 length:459 start_codon:yes stop_codon:yes gene_type:complete
MINYINKALAFFKNQQKYHQVMMVSLLLVLGMLSISQLSKISDNKKLLNNAKNDYVYVEDRINLIESKISLNQLVNNSENINSLLINISKKYNLLNFQIYQENSQKLIKFNIDDLQTLRRLVNIFSQESFIQVQNIRIEQHNETYQIRITYL